MPPPGPAACAAMGPTHSRSIDKERFLGDRLRLVRCRRSSESVHRSLWRSMYQRAKAGGHPPTPCPPPSACAAGSSSTSVGGCPPTLACHRPGIRRSKTNPVACRGRRVPLTVSEGGAIGRKADGGGHGGQGYPPSSAREVVASVRKKSAIEGQQRIGSANPLQRVLMLDAVMRTPAVGLAALSPRLSVAVEPPGFALHGRSGLARRTAVTPPARIRWAPAACRRRRRSIRPAAGAAG